MNRQRLKHLKDVLLKVRSQKKASDLFDLTDWYHDMEGANTKIEMPEGACRTSACALGWAALDPEFNNQGLSIGWHTAYNHTTYEPVYTKGIGQEGFEGFDAATNFFDINNDVSYFLFDPESFDVSYYKRNGKPMIDRVIKRIDWILESYDENSDLRRQLEDATKKQQKHLSIHSDGTLGVLI